MRWMWIDRILELEPGTRLVAIKNVSLAEEHLHDHFAADGCGCCERGGGGSHDAGDGDVEVRPAQPIMPASLIFEGCAQSAGILVGHANQFKEKVVLAKISKAELERDATPGCSLRYTATIQTLDRQGAAVGVGIELMDHGRASVARASGPAWQAIGSIDLMFSHLDQNLAGAQFPKHNFVFGESFKTLLRTSGIEV